MLEQITNPDLAALLAGRTGSFSASQLDSVRDRASKALELPERDEVAQLKTEKYRASRPGTLLANRIEKLTRYIPGIKGGCVRCKNLQEQMDRQGWRWCADNRQKLIDQIVSNAAHAHKWLPATWAEAITDTNAFRSQVAKVLDESILESQRSEPARPSRRISFKSHAVPSAEQNEQYAAAISSKPAPRPFTQDPTIHLVWHFWPVADTWQWHVDRLNELIPQINGRVIIGYVSGDGAVEFDVFRAAFNDPDRITFIQNANVGVKKGVRSGELQTAIPAFEMLPKDSDHVTIYGHGKGVRDHTRDSEAVRIWTEMMYETVTFNISETLRIIEKGYDTVGSFRTFGHQPLKPLHRWHYSGSFYAFRNDVLSKPFTWQLKYGGTECWPGDLVDANHSYCVFRDNSPLLYQYSEEFSGQMIAENLHWESSRFGDVKMEQHLREYLWLTEQLADCKSMLVIGSRHGGLEHYLRRDCPQLETIASIDIDPLPTNSEPNLIIGSSADPEIQSLVKDRFGKFDAVFIDGDHSANGARIDWEFAKALGAKRIFFHDFTAAKYHRIHNCTVHEMWPEVVAECEQNGWSVSSKVVGCGWGGIAQVKQ